MQLRRKITLASLVPALLIMGSAYAETWLCADKLGHRYKVSQEVPSDRCRQLLSPDELASDPTKIKLPAKPKHPLKPRQSVVSNTKNAPTSNYQDLPDSIRWGNNNSDTRCRQAVANVRRLENHPAFDTNRSIRIEWQEKFDVAHTMGCNL